MARKLVRLGSDNKFPLAMMALLAVSLIAVVLS